VETVTVVIRSLMSVMSAWIVFMLIYQLVISFFGFKRDTKDYQDFDPKLRFLVLVPAHNEEAVIGDIINNLKHMEYPPELYDFYILADNCTDQTATVARELGAKVIETQKEHPDSPTGKPIVLQKALQVLEGYQEQYDLVMFFDADNLIDPNMFQEVNSQFLSNEGKVDIIQCYLGSKNKQGLIALFYYMTYTITNRFFQYAKSNLGLNSVVGGTGFAVDTRYLHQRGGWNSMSLTEDFELQIEATCDGQRILWNHNVRIYDEKPVKVFASLRQRTRWAQGHWFVAFKNTGRLFRALKHKQVSAKEFLSTLLYMYSLVPYIFLMIQFLLSSILMILEWTGVMPSSGGVVPLDNWVAVNLPNILLFLYSFIFLFYVGDRLDNGNRFTLRTLIPMIVSVLLNTVLVTIAQVLGLIKHRQQSNWDKTEHSIKCLEDTGLIGQEDISQAKVAMAKDTKETEGLLELVAEHSEKTA